MNDNDYTLLEEVKSQCAERRARGIYISLAEYLESGYERLHKEGWLEVQIDDPPRMSRHFLHVVQVRKSGAEYAVGTCTSWPYDKEESLRWVYHVGKYSERLYVCPVDVDHCRQLLIDAVEALSPMDVSRVYWSGVLN